MAVQSDIFYKDLIVIPETTPQDELIGSVVCDLDKRINQQQQMTVFCDPEKENDKLKNDYFSPIIFGNNSTTDYQLFLQKSNGCEFFDVVEINDNTFGTNYFNSFIENLTINYPRIGANIEWVKVYFAYGLGCYRFKFRYVSNFIAEQIFEYTPQFNLKIYSQKGVNGTVKLDYRIFAGVNGSIKNDAERNELYFKNWSNMIRFKGAIKTQNFDGEKETARYKSGAERPTINQTKQIYTLSIENLHIGYLRTIAVDVFMADRLLVTDYNVINGEKFVDYRINHLGAFEPNINYNFFSSDVEFSQYFVNFRKKRLNIN